MHMYIMDEGPSLEKGSLGGNVLGGNALKTPEQLE